jgi:selenium-binding protein 1
MFIGVPDTRGHILCICGPEGIYVSALGAPNGEGPGRLFMLDHDAFNVLDRWEVDRGPQHLAYDFAWHLGHDVQLTSEWGTPNMIENGLVPELLLGSKYGHQLHVWDLRRRRHVQAIALGVEQQLVLELRPARDPTRRTALRAWSTAPRVLYAPPEGHSAAAIF